MAAPSWYLLLAAGGRLELQTYDDRETAVAAALALLREGRQVTEIGPVRGPTEDVVNEAALRRMLAESPPGPQGAAPP